MLAGSVVLALGSWAALTYIPADTLAQLAPVFQVVYGVVAAWIANQLAHRGDPAA